MAGVTKKLNVLIVGLGLSVCSSAYAGPSLHLTAGAWHYAESQQFFDMNAHSVRSQDVGNTDSGGGVVNPYVVTAESSGRVNGGVIKAAARSSYTTGPLAASASAFAQWSDEIRILGTGLDTGTRVFIHYSFLLDTSLSLAYATQSGFNNFETSLGLTEWRFSHYLNNNPTVNYGERIDILDNGTYVRGPHAGHLSLSEDGKIDLIAEVSIGMPTHLYMGLLAQTFIGDGRRVSSATAVADLGNSLYWGGIDDVRLADGTSVQFNVLSASGTDYGISHIPVAEVPEPGTVGMILLGGLALRLRYRSRVHHVGAVG